MGRRGEVRDYIVGGMGLADCVLIVDETCFRKKGDRSTGVARHELAWGAGCAGQSRSFECAFRASITPRPDPRTDGLAIGVSAWPPWLSSPSFRPNPSSHSAWSKPNETGPNETIAALDRNRRPRPRRSAISSPRFVITSVEPICTRSTISGSFVEDKAVNTAFGVGRLSRKDAREVA